MMRKAAPAVARSVLRSNKRGFSTSTKQTTKQQAKSFTAGAAAARVRIAEQVEVSANFEEEQSYFNGQPLNGRATSFNGNSHAQTRQQRIVKPATNPEVAPHGATVTLKLLVGSTAQADGKAPREITARVGSTLLDVAHENKINVDGTCAGDLACSTCHCVLGSQKVYENTENLELRSTLPGEAMDTTVLKEKRILEEDLLESAFARVDSSRLSCQVRVTPDMDGMEIRYPNIIEKRNEQPSESVEFDPTSEMENKSKLSSSGKYAKLKAFLDGNATGSNGFQPDHSIPRLSDRRLQMMEIKPKKFRNITKSYIPEMFKKYGAGQPAEKFLEDNLMMYSTLSNILPMRTNNYVVEELIDWSKVPDDPIFQLTFPQPGMLFSANVEEIMEAKKRGASAKEIRVLADKIREQLNPHPAKQKEMNVPSKGVGEQGTVMADDIEDLKRMQKEEGATTREIEFERGMQHKYRETVLFFPSESQYCHSYCTYCFRWAQFVGSSDLQFASNDLEELMSYLRRNKSVTDLLITGGDPMVLNSKQLARYLYPIVNDPTLDHVQDIRIGSKSLAYWPYKYVTDDDADDLLRVFENVVKTGKKHISFMAHFTHPNELMTPVVREAIRRIRNTGVVIRAQAPLVNHINNDPEIWATMWKEQLKLGIIPYYMFVERDTGAKEWFGVPLERCLEVYNSAISKVPGLARTARGPSMSCTPGKLAVQGLEVMPSHPGSPSAYQNSETGMWEEKVFILKFLQSRNPDWISRTVFAQYDPNAKWLNDLKPAFGAERFFFEEEHDDMEQRALLGAGSSGQMFA